MVADVAQYVCETPGVLPESVKSAGVPVVLKGFVSQWPAVGYAVKSDESVAEYIKGFYKGSPVVLFEASHEKNGRLFYTPDFQGLDFRAGQASLDRVIDLILGEKQSANPDTYYVGSTTVDVCLPGFQRENSIELGESEPLVSVWVGNHSRVAAHYDAPDNVACCVAGRRRFTLFPIEQVKNLYVGPLEFTPAGQPISCVDFSNVDHQKFPKFKEAMEHALIADLEPGDALFLPGMWWHHVESFGSFNVLVNYWWRPVPKYMDAPISLLLHGILCLRELPAREKQAWKRLLDYYVFETDSSDFAHIPDDAKGAVGELSDMQARKLRALLLNKLNR